jgi:hypothetical protein
MSMHANNCHTNQLHMWHYCTLHVLTPRGPKLHVMTYVQLAMKSAYVDQDYTCGDQHIKQQSSGNYNKTNIELVNF